MDGKKVEAERAPPGLEPSEEQKGGNAGVIGESEGREWMDGCVFEWKRRMSIGYCNINSNSTYQITRCLLSN